MRFDLVDRGGRSTARDPIRPLADALASAGHGVRLLSTRPPEPAPVAGVEVVRLAVRDAETARGLPALGKALGALLEPAARTVVLPFELAGLRGVPEPLVAVLPPGDAPPLDRAVGLLDRLFGGRSSRREEARAIARSRWILAPGSEERQRFLVAAPAAAERTGDLLPAAVAPPATPDRAAARRQLHLPDDVAVATYLGPPGLAAPSALARAAFQRARVFFPGARLLLPGVPSPAEPGTHPMPDADGAGRRAAARAADLLLAPTVTDPRELLGWLAEGAPVVVGPSARFPTEPPATAVRRAAADEAGALASDLAELLADPALRRRIGEAGRSYAAAYAPDRVASEFVARVAAAASGATNSSSR